MNEPMPDLKQPLDSLLAEFEEKRRRLLLRMAETNLTALHLQRTENIAWLTAGRVDRRVLLPSALGLASILLLRSGDIFYLAADNEGARLAAEDFARLPIAPRLVPWHTQDASENIRALAGAGQIASDTNSTGVSLLFEERATLTENEIERYRWLGRNTAEVTSEVLRALEPGITERTVAARIAGGLIARGIEPSVLLMAVDERILRYKHAVAQNAILDRYAMLNLCSRRWGMCISITRFVHFGPMPQQLVDAFAVAAEVNARLVAATQPGATSAGLFAIAAEAYKSLGHGGEELRHHQGGATGYSEREWLAAPSGTERVGDCLAFAWNPSVDGAKVEDTVLLRDGQIEVLTPTPDLPGVETRAGDLNVHSTGVLIR